MAALFPRWSNTAILLALFALLLLIIGTVVALMVYVRTPYNTGQGIPIDQPVEFDHRHHTIDDGIACLYCHSGAEKWEYAGVPPTDLCMGCHNQIWNDSPLLEPVRRSYFSGEPIPWNRVHKLPDFVYFNHAVHVTAGIDCISCHGKVEEMARVYQVAPFTMGWCLDCHRKSEAELPLRFLKPNQAYWKPGFGPIPPGNTETNAYGVDRLTYCTACHR